MSLWALAGIGLSALGSYNQQKTQNAYLKYQASMNRINARLANMSAESALRAGEKQQQQIMTQTAKLKGAQKTGYAASGIDLASRSVQNVLNETDYLGEVDKNQAAANALTNAWGYRLQATNFENNANIQQSQRRSPWGAALSTAVGGRLMSEGAQKGISGIADKFGGMFSVSSTPSQGGLASLSSGIGYSDYKLGLATGSGRTLGDNWLLPSSSLLTAAPRTGFKFRIGRN